LEDQLTAEISGSHGGKYEDDCLLVCSLVKLTDVSEALMMEAVSTPETSVNFYQATWRNIPEDSHLQLTAVNINT
jgi:hypothetical protein